MKKQGIRNKKLVIGLTGAFGSGKSSVAAMFKALGAEIIDADAIAHDVIKPGKEAYRNIIRAFGKSVLGKNRKIYRLKLGRIVFADKELLVKLDKITHPRIVEIIKKRIGKNKPGLIVLDAPLLIEAGLANLADKLIVVKITRTKQIARLLKKGLLCRKEILNRVKSQMPLKAKLALADFIIDNNGRIEKTRMQVKKIWEEELWKS